MFAVDRRVAPKAPYRSLLALIVSVVALSIVPAGVARAGAVPWMFETSEEAALAVSGAAWVSAGVAVSAPPEGPQSESLTQADPYAQAGVICLIAVLAALATNGRGATRGEDHEVPQRTG